MDARVFLTLIVLGLTVTPVKAELKSDSRQQIEQPSSELGLPFYHCYSKSGDKVC